MKNPLSIIAWKFSRLWENCDSFLKRESINSFGWALINLLFTLIPCSFGKYLDKLLLDGCKYSQQPSLNDDIIDDKLSLSFFKNINNTTLKNYNIENNSTMKFKIFIKHRKQDESQNATNINFECSAMSSFNRYKKNRNEEIKFNSQGQILDLYNEKL